MVSTNINLTYARDVSQYNYNLSKDEATDLVLRALFNATFHSKSTGGTLHGN